MMNSALIWYNPHIAKVIKAVYILSGGGLSILGEPGDLAVEPKRCGSRCKDSHYVALGLNLRHRQVLLRQKYFISKGEDKMAYLMNYQQYQKYNASGIYSISVIYTKPDEGVIGRKIVYIG